MKTTWKPSLAIMAAGCFLFSAISESIAFDGCGHKVVAALAFDRIENPNTLRALARIFRADLRGRKFVDAATWPDDIKSNMRNDLPEKAPVNRSWHFVDIPFHEKDEKKIDEIINRPGVVVDPQHDGSANAVTAIRFFITRLKSGEGDATRQADDLSWLIHLVGDIHQPLHAINVEQGDSLPNYTPPPVVTRNGKKSGGDRGGNGFDVETPAKELHAVWDDLFDEPTGGHGEGRDDSDANAEQIAHALEAKIRNGKLSVPEDGAKDLEPAHWAKESYEHREFVYSPEQDPANPKNHIVTDAYMDKAREIGEGRVTLAGARLAKILDDIFGH